VGLNRIGAPLYNSVINCALLASSAIICAIVLPTGSADNQTPEGAIVSAAHAGTPNCKIMAATAMLTSAHRCREILNPDLGFILTSFRDHIFSIPLTVLVSGRIRKASGIDSLKSSNDSDHIWHEQAIRSMLS
jgi:hypothetical protein